MLNFRINVTESVIKRRLNLYLFGPRERGKLKPLSPGRGIWGEVKLYVFGGNLY
jgi:hypothetical protein